MTSLRDIARANGAGPVQTPLLDLRARVILEATLWVHDKEMSAEPVTQKERALYRAVRALQNALERAEQQS